MPPITDIRQEYEDKVRALAVRWPCAPEGVEASRSSGLICATVVARAMWSRLKPKCWPEHKSSEDAITTYAWINFRGRQTGFKKSLREIWDEARESATSQQGGGTDDSFAGICRSPGFVKTFWANPLFHLTTPHWRAGAAYDGRQVVLEGEELARQAVVSWDGLEPPSVEAAVNNVTRKYYDDQGNMTFMFFRSPLLLQVDFTPGVGSSKSLSDIWRFSADKWAFVPDPYGMRKGTWEVTGQQLYTVMAVVLHRESMDGVDSVRLFNTTGREELPITQLKSIRWPFELDEAIPHGHKLTVFYTSVPEKHKTPLVIHSSTRYPQMRADLTTRMNISVETASSHLTARREEPSSPVAQSKSEAHEREVVRQIQAAALNAYSSSTLHANATKLPPPRSEPEPRASNASRTSPSLPRNTFLPSRFIDPLLGGPSLAYQMRLNATPTEPAADRLLSQQRMAAPRVDEAPKPPTEPRADRGIKREMSDEETEHVYHKKPKLMDRNPRVWNGTAAATSPCTNARSTSYNGRHQGWGNRGGFSNPGPHAPSGPQDSHSEYGPGWVSQTWEGQNRGYPENYWPRGGLGGRGRGNKKRRRNKGWR